LFLHGGKWKNLQLISQDWVRAVHQSSITNKDYGYLWWINTSKEWKDVSSEIYYANGLGGNFIVIDNEHSLVVVVRWIDSSRMGEFMSLVEQSIANKSNRK
jgi:CubicO group peptidase (beta-lactamase class C family)